MASHSPGSHRTSLGAGTSRCHTSVTCKPAYCSRLSQMCVRANAAVNSSSASIASPASPPSDSAMSGSFSSSGPNMELLPKESCSHAHKQQHTPGHPQTTAETDPGRWLGPLGIRPSRELPMLHESHRLRCMRLHVIGGSASHAPGTQGCPLSQHHKKPRVAQHA